MTRVRDVGRLALGGILIFAGTSHLSFARGAFRAQVPEAVVELGRVRYNVRKEPLFVRLSPSGGFLQAELNMEAVGRVFAETGAALGLRPYASVIPVLLHELTPDQEAARQERLTKKPRQPPALAVSCPAQVNSCSRSSQASSGQT